MTAKSCNLNGDIPGTFGVILKFSVIDILGCLQALWFGRYTLSSDLPGLTSGSPRDRCEVCRLATKGKYTLELV